MGVESAAWLGFGGVVAGAVMGYASSAGQEAARRKHEQRRLEQVEKREDAIRFEGRRFDAYVAMITAANRFYGIAKYPAVARAEPRNGELSPLFFSYEQFMTSLSPAFLMATSAQSRDCIAALASAVRALLQAVTSTPEPSVVSLDAQFSAHRLAVRNAEAAMREEFGLVPLPPPAS